MCLRHGERKIESAVGLNPPAGERRRERWNFGRPKFRCRPARWGRGPAGSFFFHNEPVAIPAKPKSSARKPSPVREEVERGAKS